MLAAIVMTFAPCGANAGFDEGLAAFGRKDYAAALREFQSAARAGHARASYYLGRMRLLAEGMPADYSQAVAHFTEAAERGDVNAQYYLGVLYYRGIGIRHDYAKAVKWYTAAAAQGDTSAQYALGVMYAGGADIARDEVAALAWFLRATAGGDAPAKKFAELLVRRMSADDIARAERKARESIAPPRSASPAR